METLVNTVTCTNAHSNEIISLSQILPFIIQECASLFCQFLNVRPPVSLAMGLASAAAHAHYVNGMVGGRGDGHHYPAAALHAAAAAAAAAASSAAAAQRAEIEREEIDRGRHFVIHRSINV